MSFAVWRSRPPFSEAQLSAGELIYFRALDGSWLRFDPLISQVPAGALFVVTSEGVPVQARVDAQLNSVPIDLSNLDNLDKTLKAIGLLMRDYCNQLKAGTYTGSGAGGSKTVAEVKADFAAKYSSL